MSALKTLGLPVFSLLCHLLGPYKGDSLSLWLWECTSWGTGFYFHVTTWEGMSSKLFDWDPGLERNRGGWEDLDASCGSQLPCLFTYSHIIIEGVSTGLGPQNSVLPNWGCPGGSDNKESSCNAGDPGSIPGSGRSPGEGNSNPFQYSCLENPLDREAWWATVHGVATSQTRLKWLSTHTMNV